MVLGWNHSAPALVEHLEDAGIGLALVTDHDSFDGARAVAEVAATRDLEIQIPVAAEIGRTSEI